MIQAFTKPDVMLPSELERQQIFYWLQEISSVTAWKRILKFYKEWVTATENSVREADGRGWGELTSLSQSSYVSILKGLAHCEEGVVRLANGDKRVFKFDANGEFEMASRPLFHWKEMITRVEEGENGIDEKHTPLWGEFCQAARAAAHAWEECSSEILQPRYLEEPGLTLYGDWLKAKLKKLTFPSTLETVPDPAENTFVRTSEYTPCSGIWEPIEDSTKKNLIVSFFTNPGLPKPPFVMMGAMNYLHAGSKAPRITIETATDNIDLDTTWRLLWRDDRYSDGTIPEKEVHYQFNQPLKTQEQRPSVGLTDEIMWAESGAAVPAAGTWLVESDISAKITVEKGEKLPQHRGLDVRWVLAAK